MHIVRSLISRGRFFAELYLWIEFFQQLPACLRLTYYVMLPLDCLESAPLFNAI